MVIYFCGWKCTQAYREYGQKKNQVTNQTQLKYYNKNGYEQEQERETREQELSHEFYIKNKAERNESCIFTKWFDINKLRNVQCICNAHICTVQGLISN